MFHDLKKRLLANLTWQKAARQPSPPVQKKDLEIERWH